MLLCAMDRIFDDATVFNIHGESFRGKRIETVALQAGRGFKAEIRRKCKSKPNKLCIWAVGFIIGYFKLAKIG